LSAGAPEQWASLLAAALARWPPKERPPQSTRGESCAFGGHNEAINQWFGAAGNGGSKNGTETVVGGGNGNGALEEQSVQTAQWPVLRVAPSGLGAVSGPLRLGGGIPLGRPEESGPSTRPASDTRGARREARGAAGLGWLSCAAPKVSARA